MIRTFILDMDLNQIFTGILTPAKWRELGRYLMSQQIRSGHGVRVTKTQSGILISAAARGREMAAAATCLPFYQVFIEPNPAAPSQPRTMLRGGIVSGGATNTIVADIELELQTGGTARPNGTRLFLIVNFTAVTADDVLMPGVATINSTSLTYVAPGAAVPDNKLPKSSDATGRIHISLGEIQSGRFVPVKCGDKTIYHCPGSINHAP